MRAVSTLTVLVLCAALLGAGSASPRPDAATLPMGRAELANQLEAALAASGWDDDRWSVLVVSLDRGDTLFALRPEESRVPASNLKLFTTAAALHVLGPDYRYPTFVTAVGPVRAGVLDGDLLVYGTGDPTLSARFFESRTAVWEAIADSLAAAGITRIAGDLVGDASYFEGAAVGQGWQTSYVTHTYAAPASALSFNDNVVTLRVTPADRAGDPPDVLLVPGGSVDMRVEATTAAAGRTRIYVEREDYRSPIVLKGTIRRGATAQWRAVTVVDPARYAMSVLHEVLADRGIAVDGRIRSEYEPRSSPVTGQSAFAPASAEDGLVQVLAVHRSPPLQEILEVINQRSHNLYADAVLRTVGRVASGHGSVAGGRAAVAALLEVAGPAGRVVEMDDGSGLSPLDRASARSIVELLAFMNASPHGAEYRATLPEAATSRGLRRMQRTPAAGNLRAKTGTIERVSALSGYVRARNGEMLAFSILSNDVPSTWRAKRVEDRIGASLASFDRPAPSVAATAPVDPGDRPAGSTPDSTTAVPSPADTTGPVQPGAERTYTIRRGDTLDGIARELGTTVAAIRDANPGVDPRRLMPGDTLRVPGGG